MDTFISAINNSNQIAIYAAQKYSEQYSQQYAQNYIKQYLQSTNKVINPTNTTNPSHTTNSKNETNTNNNITNELLSDFYKPIGDGIANQWNGDYVILNTNKWQVPMPRPPVCINNSPCKVCPSNTSSDAVNLNDWDNSRYVLQNPSVA